MKTLYYLTSMLITLFLVRMMHVNKHENTTRGANLERKVKMVVHISKDYDLDKCETKSYEYICDELGINLYWSIPNAEQKKAGRLAYASGNDVVMLISRCDYYVNEVFFHEIGHILLGHQGENHHLDYEEVKEVEADYFSMYVMDKLGIDPKWDRFQLLTNNK